MEKYIPKENYPQASHNKLGSEEDKLKEGKPEETGKLEEEVKPEAEVNSEEKAKPEAEVKPEEEVKPKEEVKPEEESQKEEVKPEEGKSEEEQLKETQEQQLILAAIKERDEKRWQIDKLYEQTTEASEKKHLEQEHHRLSEEVLELQRQYASLSEQAETKQENLAGGSAEAQDQNQKQESQEKENLTQEKSAEFIKQVFQSEYNLVSDLPENTFLQKQFKSQKYVEFLNDAKSYYGIDGIMPLIDGALDKIKGINPFYAEHSARAVALEMASQFYLDKKSPSEKVDNIKNFVTKWLKDQNVFYQGAEKLKNSIADEDSPEEDKWLAEEIGTLAKLLTSKDRTVSQIAQLLASQNVSYDVAKSLVTQIENQNILKNTISEYLRISKLPFDEKMAHFAKLKQELSTEGVPDMEKIKRLSPELAQELPAGASEVLDKLNQQVKQNPQVAEQIQNKAQEVLKNKGQLPRSAKAAADFIEKKTLKGGKLSKFGGAFLEGLGYSILMLLCLNTAALGKILEAVTGVNIGTISGGGKKH